MRETRARELRQAALLAAQGATDGQAMTMPSLYPLWAPGTAYGGPGEPQIVRAGEALYRVRQAHTSQTGWEPEQTPALWAAIDETHAGTPEDPIPASRGMEYVYGRYYRDPEDGQVYQCARAGEPEGGKIVLQYLPHEVEGQYFQRTKEDNP